MCCCPNFHGSLARIQRSTMPRCVTFLPYQWYNKPWGEEQAMGRRTSLVSQKTTETPCPAKLPKKKMTSSRSLLTLLPPLSDTKKKGAAHAPHAPSHQNRPSLSTLHLP